MAKKILLILVFMAVAVGLVFGQSKGKSGSSKKLDALLSTVTPQIEQWGDTKNVAVYSLNPEIKDESIKAAKDAGFYPAYSGKFDKKGDVKANVFQWGVLPRSNGKEGQIRISASGEKVLRYYGFLTAPASGGIPKTIKITGYNLNAEKVDALRIRAKSEGAYDGNGMPAAVAGNVEADGQTLTLRCFAGLSYWEGDWELWAKTGAFFVVLQNSEPKDKTKKSAFYAYMPDGVNPTAVNIKDEVTTLEWSKFVWIRDGQ